jgi:hypothetical protein
MKLKTSRLVASAVALFPTIATGQPQQAAACEECQLRKEGTYMGQFTLMGNGTVRSFVTYGKGGKPSSLGVTFSESALSGLREKLLAGMPMWEYALALPSEARVTGFDHISLDWNPRGHETTDLKTWQRVGFDRNSVVADSAIEIEDANVIFSPQSFLLQHGFDPAIYSGYGPRSDDR